MLMKHYSHHLTFNAMLITMVMMFYMNCMNMILVLDWGTLSSNEFQFSITLMVDNNSLIFLTTVSLVSSAVMNYSRSYMEMDCMKEKFFITMMLFILSMMILSSSANLFWLMVGWDGLGLTSFFLIMHFQNWNSLNSAMTTFISNRIGDLFMIMGMMWMINVNSLFSCNFNASETSDKFVIITLSILLAIAAMSKSAQIPFSAWLPLAMAAPTPVSSLVHSSTLVTAGVFLTIRFFPLINNDMLSWLMLVISSATMILASMSAMWEYDLKKIIALSTLSHIGFMMMFVSIGNIQAAMLHMSMHALFKSLLFMCAGVMIHENMNMQDIRQIFLPCHLKLKTSASFTISVFSMMGIPFMSGFYSKDFMVLSSLEFSMEAFVYLVTITSALFTCMYSTRLVYTIMNNSSNTMTSFMNESSSLNNMEKSMFAMSSFSSVMGGMMVNIIISMELTGGLSFNDPYTKLMLLAFMMTGIGLGIVFANSSMERSPTSIKVMCNKMWFVSYIAMPMQYIYLMNSRNLMMFNDTKGWLDNLFNKSFILMIDEITGKLNSTLMKVFMLNMNVMSVLTLPLLMIVIYSVTQNLLS